MLQVRFVAACANGHLRDLPWAEWLSAAGDSLSAGEINALLRTGDARLRLKNTGETGGAGVLIELIQFGGDSSRTRILAKRTLAGAFGSDPTAAPENATPLARAGVRCRGENPAVAISPGDKGCIDCDEPLHVVLKGAGNLYFADVASAIHIPDRVPGRLPEEVVELFDDDSFMSELIYDAAESPDGKLDIRSAKRALSRDKSWINVTGHLDDFVDAFNSIEPLRTLSSPNFMERLRQLRHADALNTESLRKVLAMIPYQGEQISEWKSVPDGLLQNVEDRLDGRDESIEETDGSPSLRQDEFKVFSQKQEEVVGMPKSILKIRSKPIDEYGEIVSNYFEHVSLLDTLRETRVLKGFSRLYARGRSLEDYKKLLWRSVPRELGGRWLPATMVYGEGIFLRFRASALAEWESSWVAAHHERLKAVSSNMAALARRRGVEPDSSHPRLAMIHTFAHLLINQLIFDSGYGSSSLRERLYFSEPSAADPGMAGLLIYTAAGDSEGSMGGLVRMGEAGKLENVVRRALENALWCSSDPVCIESHGQGPDNCNLAACHSCGLLPETSCENQNRLLDRGAVVGTLESPGIGYFSSICRASMVGS